LNELALFAGAGGGILGGKLLGWRTVCAVEWEQYPASVLCARQNDGLLPPFPIWDDVQTFDGKPWRGIVDVVSGGFPCQDISAAGKGVGIDGERSGMWREMARIIHEVRPRFVYVENSPMLTSRGLGAVLGDLATMGFDAKWGVLGANDIGANHQRDRIWIVAKWRGQLPHAQHDRIRWWEQQSQSFEKEIAKLANTECMGWEERPSERGELVNQETSNQSDYCGETSGEGETIANSERTRLERREDCGKQEVTWTRSGGSPIGHASWWSTEPNVGRVAHGVAARMERIKAIGNGQVPLCAATAWRILK
jgi:DNA (cytosine-5)-methyltransferase 1